MSKKSNAVNNKNYSDLYAFVNCKYPGSVCKASRESFSTGCFNLDLILPENGIPSRGITEIYGPESSGKSTIAINLMASAQKSTGQPGLYLDFEHKMRPDYAKKLGVDFYDPTTDLGNRSFLLLQPQSIEEAYQYLNQYGKDFSLIVIDSVTAMRPREKINKKYDDTYFENPSLATKVFSAFFSYASHKVFEHDLALLCLSQTRMSGDAYFHMAEKPAGGRAQRHFVALSIGLSPSALTSTKSVRGTKSSPVSRLTLSDQIILTHVTATITKDCVGGNRGLQTAFYLFADGGICNSYPLLEQTKKHGLYKVKQNGYHYLYDPSDNEKAIVSDRTLHSFLKKIESDKDAIRSFIDLQPDADSLNNILNRSFFPGSTPPVQPYDDQPRSSDPINNLSPEDNQPDSSYAELLD